MPDKEALQVFWGTVPLIGVLIAIWLREQVLLKDVLARLGRIEGFIDKAGTRLA